MTRNHTLGVLCVLLSAILFSAKSVLVKLAYQYAIDAETLLVLRMLFSLPFFLGMLWLAHEPGKRLNRKEWLGVILAGGAGYYGAGILDFMGLAYISASLERLLLFMYPTLTVFLSALFLKTRITGRVWLAILVSYTGMLLVFSGDRSAHSPQLWLGSLLVFGGALAYAGYLVASGELMKTVGAARFTALALTVATACALLHFSIQGSWRALASLPAPLWGLCAALGFFCTFLPASLITQGIRHIGAASAALIGAVGPVFTLMMGAVFLDEKLTGVQIAGGIFVLAGVVMISFRPSPPEVAPE
ncbi:threonine/homoserine efflux transporter RhtA [Fluviicoccus keumensis]|uniref:Threonine/homoserine efflux transporter RhtA n=1 Tax=Fluviicoccus keumensis TaxID=1435465 RepID=A0A4Q7Z9T9_9GAMM|nr:DMT family transporter [Fluviicoccus keumensis]RZU47300.1 threonine/homoserine efflux transporter RhtA [Fluviicoccus keumensis]